MQRLSNVNRLATGIPVSMCLCFLTSCAAPTVMSASGPSVKPGSGQFAEFSATYDAAVQTKGSKEASELLSSGFALIDTNCRDYFRQQGKLQQVLYFVRDSANILAPIAAGALAIGRAGTNTIAVVTLSTAAETGLINTVASDFLFNADNIDDVQTLVMTDLAAHEDKVNGNRDANPTAVTFDWAITQLADHQNHCQPAHILSVARQAIKNGTIESYNQGSSSARLSAQSLEALRGALAKIVGASPSDDAIAALYWLSEKPDVGRFYKAISQKLSSLGTSSPFDISGKLKPSWTQTSDSGSEQSRVKSAFDSADATLRAQLDAQIGKWTTATNNFRAEDLASPLSPAFLGPAVAASGSSSLPSHVGTRVVPALELP